MARRPTRRIGFTGTREGMTGYQSAALCELLCDRLTNPRFLGVWWLHHGCCQGADAEAHSHVDRFDELGLGRGLDDLGR